MAVQNQLAGFLAALSHAHSVNHVVKTALQKDQEVFTGHALHLCGSVKIASELLFQNAVISLCLLLFAELKTVFLHVSSAIGVRSGRVGTSVKRALSGKATVALQKQFRTFSAAKLARRTCISCH